MGRVDLVLQSNRLPALDAIVYITPDTSTKENQMSIRIKFDLSQLPITVLILDKEYSPDALCRAVCALLESASEASKDDHDHSVTYHY